MWPLEDFPDINVHSYIGVIIAIAGNILISVALNVQKYAHNQLQPGAGTDAELLQTTPTYVIEEETFSARHDTQPLQGVVAGSPYLVDDEDYRSVRSTRSTRYSNHSRRSSVQSHNNDDSYDTDTSEQSEPLAVPRRTRADGEEDCDSAVSDTDYLQSKAWWAGMTLMILGECGNFLAYGYAQASIIAPLGTVALVSNVILAPLMLREPFRSRDLLGITIAIIGTVVVVINSKENEVKLTPEAVIAALLQTQFIVYFIVCCVLVSILASLSDTIGSVYIFIDLSIVAIFGGYTVLATKGVSSLLSLSFYKMFTYPIAYLLVFVLVTTAVLQIKFLNKSLQRFDSTQVIPTQFVLFTTSAIIGSAILYNDFDEMDFNKGLHFLAGCCMTFIGVYFITSHRDKDGPGAQVANANAEWTLTVPPHYKKSWKTIKVIGERIVAGVLPVSYKATHHPHYNQLPSQSSSNQVRSTTAHTADPRFHALYLQERTTSQEGLAVKQQLRHKPSQPLISKEQPYQSKQSKDPLFTPKVKTLDVAVPGRKGGDRHHMSPSEQDFATAISRSIDSVSKGPAGGAAAAARILPGGMLSSSPTTKPVPHGSEYAFQTLRSPTDTSLVNSSSSANQSGSSAHAGSLLDDHESAVSLPPNYPTDAVHPQQTQQTPQIQQSRTKKKDAPGEESELTVLPPTRKDSR
ncbi:hypothetical protein BGX28_009679 [Mortierella sp. GBA30]|nr:hypothetical protein BGX28_009679 [Mortierella sp. GBA30]